MWRSPLLLIWRIGLAIAALAACAMPAEVSPLRMHGQLTVSACTGQPAGIVALNLCNVRLLKSANGPRIATTNVAVYPSPPAGFSYSASTQNTDATGIGGALDGINNAGHGGFYFSGNGTWTMTDFALTSNAGVTLSGFPLGTGITSGGSATGATNLDGEWGTIDGVGMDDGRTTMVQPHGLGTFKLAHVNLIRPARDQFVSSDPGGTFVFDSDYFDVPCQNTTPGDHCEPLHALTGGTYTITGNYFNMADGTQSPSAGNSGNFQLQTGQGNDPSGYLGGPLVATITGNVINYGCPLNQTVLSLKAVFDDITVNFGSNAVCPGTTALNHVIVTQADIKVGAIVGTFTSGETILRTGGGSAPLLGALTGGNNLHLLSWGTGTHFGVGDGVTGQTSGATAIVTSATYHNVTINDLGGNLNYDGTPYTP